MAARAARLDRDRPHDVAPARDGGIWYTAQLSGELGWLDPKFGLTKAIKLGPVITPDQIKRQAKAFNELGVIPKDVSGEIDKFWDASFLEKAMKK